MDTTTQNTGGKPSAQQLASAVAEQGGQVSQQAAAQVKDVAGTAAEQARQVGQEAAAQARSIVEETKGKAHDQAEAQTQQLASAMGRLGDQMRALLAGNPEEAGHLSEYAQNAVSQFDRLTQRVQEGGIDGALHDVQRFARRRPGMFLLGASALGLGVGRLLRAGAAQPAASQSSQLPGPDSTHPVPSDFPLSEVAPVEATPAIAGGVAVPSPQASGARGGGEW